MQPKRLMGCCVMMALSVAARAEDVAPLELDPMVVVASKAARPLSEVAGQVSVITAENIETRLVEDLDDLFRYEPGIDAEVSGTRFGLGGIAIRGIGGNRVAVEIDGAPVRKGFAVGSYSNAGRALLETDRVKRLEVLHGPASTLYGSDALGGVLAFTTWDPDDLLSRDGSAFLGLRAGYRGADDGWTGSAIAAMGGGAHGFLASATLREGHETDSAAVSSEGLDRQDWSSDSVAFRYTYDTPAGSRFRISADTWSRDTDTELRSLLGFGRFRSTTAMSGFDSDEREQWLLDADFTTDFLDQGVVRVFTTRHETQQRTLEERATAREPARYLRDFRFASDLDGLELNGFRRMDTEHGEHHLGAGLTWLQTDVSERRDGWQQNLTSGEISNIILGEVMPVRDFPNSTTREWGVFVQDEIRFNDGGWELIPALRYDHYTLDPKADALYLEDYPDTPIVGLEDDRFSPRLAARVNLGSDWSLYGQWVNGFRAPPVEDVNIGFELSLFRYKAIPNPELESETSQGYEVGLRQFRPGRSLSLTWFDTDYENFIESRVPLGFDPQSGYLLFQSRNINEASIYGVDLRFDQDLGQWSERLASWRLNLAGYWSRGRNEDNGQPLNSVSPPQAVLGLAWVSDDGAWETGLNGTFTARQDRVDETAGERFKTPGSSVFDLTAGWRINRHLSLRAAVFNLTDKVYWRWSDVANLGPGDPVIPLLGRPGRSFSVSARVTW